MSRLQVAFHGESVRGQWMVRTHQYAEWLTAQGALLNTAVDSLGNIHR